LVKPAADSALHNVRGEAPENAQMTILPPSSASSTDSGAPAVASPASGLVRSAGTLGLGNITSRIIGLAREAVISWYFGSSGELSAFNLAARVPAMIYDLLVGGMLSAALVPIFSDYARPERRPELARVASAVLSLVAILMAAIVLFLEIFAVPVANILGDFEDPALQVVLAQSLRLISPAVLLFGLSGVVSGLLYALKRFNYAALGGAVFNLGIVVSAPLLARSIGIYALPLGVLGGSVLQLGLMLPGLRDLRLQLLAGWRHPAVRRIFRLYLPIALGLIVTQAQIIVDGRWASATGAQSVSWMRYATTLIQMPLGLVPVAVSLAALPSLSQKAAQGNWTDFGAIFARGLRLIVVLLIPATVGLWILAGPVIALLFQHGNFSAYDTQMTSQALRLYLLGLPFAGVDFLLNYSFYARQNTRAPAIVGVIAVGIYFVFAVSLKGPYGYLGLVFADSAKQAGHALIMTILVLRTFGRPHGGIARSAASAIGASAAMALIVWGLSRSLAAVLPEGLLGEFLAVGMPAGVGALVYLAVLRLSGSPEAVTLTGAIRQRFRRGSGS
jgi:putative peptidoglycan lipid II flippase